MLSTKKVIRDIIAIVLITVVGVMVYKSYVATRADQHNHEADPHSSMQGDMTGDGSTFELDNHEDAISIDGKVYSMADVDNKARHFVAMMGGNPAALTKEVLARARSEAVKTLHIEAAMNKGAKEFGIEITDEDVNKEITKIVEQQGGEEKYRKFLSDFNVTEEAMERRMRKDLLQTSIFDSLIETNNLQDESDEAKNEAYDNWLGEVSQDIQIKMLSESLRESLTPPALDPHSDPHTGISTMDDSEPEEHQHDHDTETESENETP